MSKDEASFAEQGHATLSLFDPATVRAAQADIAEHIDRVAHALHIPFEDSFPDAPLGQRFQRIWSRDRSLANLLRLAVCTDAHRGPQLQALATAPELKRAAERLAGRPLGDSIQRVRAGIDIFPEHRHAWHSDVARDDGTSCGRVAITAWIPLADAGPDSGGLEVIPGRRTAPLPHNAGRSHTIDEDALEGLPRIRPSCPAGSALFLDRFTPHRSLNAATEARFALVIWMKAA